MKFADGLTRTKKRRPPKLALRRPRILRPPIFRSARNRLALFFFALFLVFGAFAADLGELDSAGLFRFAYLSLKRGEATNAFLAARTFLERYGEEDEMTNYFPRIKYFGAVAAYKLGRFEEAAELFSRVIKEHPDFSEIKNARYGNGLAEMELGHFLSAADIFRELLAEDPGEPGQLKANLALALTKAGRYGEALPYWEEIRDLKTLKGLAAPHLSWCLAETGRAGEALVWLRAGLLLDKKEKFASLRNYLALRLGDVMYMSNDFRGALSAYRLADKDSCGEARLARLARACYDAFYYPECVLYCEEGRRISTNDFVKTGLLKLECYACLQGGYLDRLDGRVEELLAENLRPEEKEALALLPAQGAMKAGEHLRAREKYLTFAEKYPESPLRAEAKLYAFCALAFSGKESEAREEAKAWLEEFGGGHKLAGEALYWKGMLAYYQGLDEEARADFELFRREHPESSHAADVAFRLAAILYREERYEVARKALEAVLERYPGYDNAGEVRNTLGDALGALGALVEALAAYGDNFPGEGGTPDAPACYALLKSAEIYKVLGRPRLVTELLEPYLLLEGAPGFRGEALGVYLEACGILGEKEKARTAARKLWLKTRDDRRESEALRALEAGMKLSGDPEGFRKELKEEALLELGKGRTGVYSKACCFLGDDEGLARLRPETLGPEALKRRLSSAGRKRAGEAEALARRLTEEFPDDPAAAAGWLLLAESSLEKNEFREAALFLSEGEAAFASLEDLYKKGEIEALSLKKQGKTKEALEKFLGLLGQKGLPPGKKAALLSEAGDCYLAEKKYAEALSYYQRIYVMYQGEKEAVRRAYKKSLACLEALGLADDRAAVEKEARERGCL